MKTFWGIIIILSFFPIFVVGRMLATAIDLGGDIKAISIVIAGYIPFGILTLFSSKKFSKLDWSDANNIDEIDYDDWNYETVTIYNWKDGRIPTEPYQWHVGGTSYNATEVIDMIVDNFNRNGENHNGEREYEKVS